MTQQRTEFDDRDLEALLHATFDAEASRRVPDARRVPPMRPAEPAATVHPLRRRTTGLVLVAAALTGLVAGGAILGREALDAAPTPRLPAATTVAPAPTESPTPTSTPTVAPTPTSSPSTSVSVPPPVATRQVTVQGVVLTVPQSWTVVTGSDVDINPGSCLSSTGAPAREAGFAADTCELTVTVGTAGWGSTDVDAVGFEPDGGICGTDNLTPDQTVTTSADQFVVDGVQVEHRVFTGACLDWHIQQWTVPTSPFVQFTRRTGDDDPAGLAAAEAVVRSARFPGPRSSLWVDDHGYLAGMTGTTVSLDRYTLMDGRGPVDDNPATYDYPLAADCVIEYSDPDHHLTLTLDQLRTLADGGTVAGVPSRDALAVEIVTDGTRGTRVELGRR